MKTALRFAFIRALRTVIQGLAGVAAAIPAVATMTEAKIAVAVAFWSTIGVAIAGLAAFLQNLSEKLEEMAP